MEKTYWAVSVHGKAGIPIAITNSTGNLATFDTRDEADAAAKRIIKRFDWLVGYDLESVTYEH